jgi:hypothetical protein
VAAVSWPTGKNQVRSPTSVEWSPCSGGPDGSGSMRSESAMAGTGLRSFCVARAKAFSRSSNLGGPTTSRFFWITSTSVRFGRTSCMSESICVATSFVRVIAAAPRAISCIHTKYSSTSVCLLARR